MEVWVNDTGRLAVVTAVGELDLARGEELRLALLQAGQATGLVLLDLARCTFLDSTAIGIMVGAQRRLNSTGARLLVVNAARGPRRVLELLGLQSLLAPAATTFETATG